MREKNPRVAGAILHGRKSNARTRTTRVSLCAHRLAPPRNNDSIMTTATAVQ